MFTRLYTRTLALKHLTNITLLYFVLLSFFAHGMQTLALDLLFTLHTHLDICKLQLCFNILHEKHLRLFTALNVSDNNSTLTPHFFRNVSFFFSLELLALIIIASILLPILEKSHLRSIMEIDKIF